VIRVKDDYYLAGTTMHMNPALIVLHSKDLVNWELASYCMDRLDLGPAFRLQGGDIYGQGIWAPCIRYHDGMFYIFSNINGAGCQVFRSKSASGPWARNQLPGMHDLSVLFDDDAPGGAKIYAVYAATNVQIVELNKDLTAQVPGTLHPLGVRGLGEGHHLYKINGKYFDVSALPGAHTDQVVARADSIDGPWQVERMVTSESLGTPTQNAARNTGRGPTQTFGFTASDPNAGGGLTIHQGGIVDTPNGQWWSIIMSDHGSVGRLVNLVPITWDNNFPLIGLPGNLRKAPNTWLKPDTGHQADPPKPLFIHSDNFDAAKLNPVWQWNHVPDDAKWSLTESPGKLRLHSLPAPDFWTARNTLTQRPVGPECIATVEIDGTGLAIGDTAGLALLNQPYATIYLWQTAYGLWLQTFDQSNRKTTLTDIKGAKHLWLRAACNFDTEKAVFSWSSDGKTFAPAGDPFTMIFQLKTFQGIRIGLFNYNAPFGPATAPAAGTSTSPATTSPISPVPGGYADFDNFTLDEPRAAGIERSIPIGKTISFTSAADNSILAIKGDELVSLTGVVNINGGAESPVVLFHIVDRGLGRVALLTPDGRALSVLPDGTGVMTKSIPQAALTDAETFQWVNLLQGHAMVMSLTNHRYLFAKPNIPGPITATATGPKPDRKDGACFTWKE
ncbi:MAG TPA: glycoside hydrolase 43 family protein, partial [Phycisphaerae bacterium]